VALRGEVLATRTIDRKVSLWRGGRRQVLATEEKPRRDRPLPDGETLLALGGGAAFLWRTVDGTQVARLEGADRAAFSADGQTVATAGRGAIRRWTRDGAMTATVRSTAAPWRWGSPTTAGPPWSRIVAASPSAT
jgi:hypothetical protein